RVYPCHEAGFEAVGELERLGLGFEAVDDGDRAKDFFAGDRESRIDIVEDRRLNEITAVQPLWPASSETKPGAVLFALFDIAADLLVLFLRSKRPKRRVFFRAADGERGDLLLKLRQE